MSIFFFRLNLHTCPFLAVARKVPFDNPQVLDYVRIAYVASQAISLLVYYYTSHKVRQNFSLAQLNASHVRGHPDKVKERSDPAQIRCVSS